MSLPEHENRHGFIEIGGQWFKPEDVTTIGADELWQYMYCGSNNFFGYDIKAQIVDGTGMKVINIGTISSADMKDWGYKSDKGYEHEQNFNIEQVNRTKPIVLAEINRIKAILNYYNAQYKLASVRTEGMGSTPFDKYFEGVTQ